jgi:TRAP transporter 4TM/12TM fusion protein
MSEEKKEEGEGRSRKLQPTLETAGQIYIIAAMLFHLLYISDLLLFAGSSTGLYWLIIPEDAFRALHLCLMVPIVFLLVTPGSKASSEKFPWYDGILIMLCFVVFGGRFLFWKEIASSLDIGSVSIYVLLMGVIGALLVFEVLRRTMGMWMVFLSCVFFFYPLYAQFLPGFLYSRPMSLSSVITELFLGYRQGAFSSLINISSQIVLPFVLLGTLLEKSGAGHFYTNLFLSFLGRLRSGPAQTAVWGSSLVGSISAVPSANVAITGVITIPLMKRVGYTGRYAAALEAVAASGGAIMPPVMASAAFLMADLLDMSYWQICVAAFIPALIYFFSIAVMAYIESYKMGIKPLPPEEIPPFKQTLKDGWQFILPLVVLIFVLGILQYAAQKAALSAILTLFIVSFFKKETRLTWKKISVSLRGTARSSTPLSALFFAAGILVASLSVSGLDFRMVNGLIQMAGGNTFILLLLGAIMCIILGMPLNPTAAYIILVLLLVPALKTLGIIPLATHMFVFYFAILGPITPPTCNCCFVAAAVAGEPKAGFAVGWQAMRLSIVLMIMAFGFVYSPSLLMQGTTIEILLSTVTAFIGAFSFAIGVEGWFISNIRWLERSLFIVSGICLIWPGWATDIVGVLLFIALVGFKVLRVRYSQRVSIMPGS